MAGATAITKAPWPVDQSASVVVPFSVYVGPEIGVTPLVLWEHFMLFDATCEGFYDGFQMTEAAGIDGVLIRTKDATKNIRASADIDATTALAKGTQHADTATQAYTIKQGDIIQILASGTTGEGGNYYGQILLKPVHS